MRKNANILTVAAPRSSTAAARVAAFVLSLTVALPALAADPTAPTADPTSPASNPTTSTAIPAAPLAEAATPAAAPAPAASTPDVTADKPAEKDKKPWPWSGAVTFRNMTSATALDPGYEQTYLPSEALALLITPRYKINDTMAIGLWQYATVELSNTANTRYYREPQLSDTLVSFNWGAYKTKFGDVTDKKNTDGFALSLQGIWGLPTSKASIAKQMYSALSLGVGARLTTHKFTVGLTTRFGHNFYKSNTMQYESPWLTTCTGTAEGCDPYQSSGVRSSEWRILAIGSLSYAITEKLGVSVSAGEIMDWLPRFDQASVRVPGGQPITVGSAGDQNFRALMYYGIGADFAILDWLAIGAGLETYNSQQKLDSSYETPFVNRYSTMYLEVSVALDGLPH